MIRSRTSAVVVINGQRHEVSGEQAFMMLADYLRYSCGLVGTKVVCAEGDCGACTVLRASVKGLGSETYEAINSCIVMMAQLDGCDIVTVEGLAPAGQMSPVQEAVARCHGSQCGYCTPGFVMAITACVQRSGPQLDAQGVKNYLTGNLCRCTGYAPLIEATLQVDRAQHQTLSVRSDMRLALKSLVKKPLAIETETRKFFAPVTMAEAVRIKRRHSDARLIASATDLGVEMNKGKSAPQTFLSLHLIPELYRLKVTARQVSCGARVSLAELRRGCETILPELARNLNIFASPQIKNMATLVGNIANGSPIGDSLPFLLVSDAAVTVQGSRSTRLIPLRELYRGYRQLAIKADEIITSVQFQRLEARDGLRLYKVSQRRDLDIATVNAAFAFRLKPQAGGGWLVEEARIAFGGVGPLAIRCEDAEDALRSRLLNAAQIAIAQELIQKAIAPLSDLRGSAAYRRVLAGQLFERYCSEIGGGSLGNLATPSHQESGDVHAAN